jgi:hypothetical protein
MDTGDFPGYEFDVPRGQRHGYGPRHAIGHDSLHQLQRAPQPPPPPRPSVRAVGGVLAVMRKRNWLMGLAAPVLAAITVGIAVVVVTGGGGNGGTAPSALAAGFPPAQLAGADFTGTTGTARVILAAIGASAATEVAVGSANGGPAVWVSADGGGAWTRAVLGGPASLTRAGTGQLAWVAHGAAGWLAVGTTLNGKGGPLVATSPDALTWTVARGLAGPAAGNAGNAVMTAVAAGPAGYVIVGHQAAARAGAAAAAAWYAPGLSGWQRAVISPPGGAAQLMNAATATARGFAAVGATGTRPAVWLSAAGRTWQQVQLPQPSGAVRAALDYVAANGTAIVAAGTEFSATGTSRPFAEVSADAGRTWKLVPLPVPDIGPGTGTTVTALTAAGGGFTAAGTYLTAAGPEVVIWTLPPGSPVDGTAWTAVTPQGTGLASPTTENAITALTADGATLTGVGFTAALTGSGSSGAQRPTLWQSPIR